MPIEYRADNGELVWIRNPFTGVVTYFTHLHRKRSGFTSRTAAVPATASDGDRAASAAQLSQELETARRSCPFCPGNEAQTPPEILRINRRDVLPDGGPGDWLIRAVPNLIPRIPECCTGGRNESYVVIEDPRHFVDGAQGHEDLLYSGLLPLVQFQALLAADVDVARHAYANPAVHAVLIRKNQGRESGASQPHVHNQIIGSDLPFAPVARECEVTAQVPTIWDDIAGFARERGFLLDENDGCVAYFCPFGTFPRSYDVVCLTDWARGVDLPTQRWRIFGHMLYAVLKMLGPVPLDYEIHEGPAVPIHAHINERYFAYSNIGGTLNLPSSLVVRR